MTAPLRVGDLICNNSGEGEDREGWNTFPGGFFGRDGYGPFRIEAIGADWVVARDDGGTVWFGEGNPEDLVEYR